MTQTRSLLVAASLLPVGLSARADPSGFMNGVDVSALAALEADGAFYRDEAGATGDALQILRDQGADWFRLRLFVDPNGQGQVVNDLQYTLAMAQRVKASGANLLLDFHYSDTWADPGQQTKPAAWQGLSFPQLETQVRDYTRDVLDQMQAAGVMPQAVQLGNEIQTGMIWDHGRLYATPGQQSAEFDRLADLLAAAAQGVDQAAADSAVAPQKMIHFGQADNWGATSFFFDRINSRGVEYDSIGFSYYPRFHGTIDEVRFNLEQTAATYGKPVVLAEVGFAYSGPQFEPQQEQFVFDVTPTGQAAFTEAVMDAVIDLPNGLGAGVFWWHGDAVPTNSGLAWNGGRLGLFDQARQVLPAAAVLGYDPDAPAVQFTEGIADPGTPSDAYGQSFAPGIDPRFNPALQAGDAVTLAEVAFASGGQGGFAATRLLLVDGVAQGLSLTDGLSPGDPGFLALSENALDTDALAYGDDMVFTFGPGIDLDYFDTLSALFVVESAVGVYDLVPVSTAFIEFIEPSPGTFIPVNNYGGANNLQGTAFFSSGGGNPVLTGANDAFDLSFRATFLVPGAALPGDANGDGAVDLLDFDVLAQNFGSATSAGASSGDFNGDGAVDLLDFDVLAQNFGATSPGVVPEPASAALLGLGCAALVRTRRARRPLP
ncbi:MAG: glycosyl hydrolase 53 family protein [Planctomycetota bacterium]